MTGSGMSGSSLELQIRNAPTGRALRASRRMSSARPGCEQQRPSGNARRRRPESRRRTIRVRQSPASATLSPNRLRSTLRMSPSRSTSPSSTAFAPTQYSPENKADSGPLSFSPRRVFTRCDKPVVNIVLDRLQPLHVVRIFGQERIEHRPCARRRYRRAARCRVSSIALSRPNVAPTTPIEPRIEDGSQIDLVGRAGDHVAAGGADILDKGDDRQLVSRRQAGGCAER